MMINCHGADLFNNICVWLIMATPIIGILLSTKGEN